MSNYKITDSLKETIKTKRKEAKISGINLSKILKKGEAYISQIESGKIKSIDTETLILLFRNIATNLNDDEFDIFINEILEDKTNEMTPEQIEKEKWILFFDYQIREFPIEDSLISFINDKLIKLNTDAIQLVDLINKNIDLPESNNIEKENELYIEIIPVKDGYIANSTIKFNIDSNTIEKILNKEKLSCNYILMQGIIYNILILEGIDNITAKNSTKETLYKYNFMTIAERTAYIKNKRKEKINNDEKFNFYDILPSQKEKEYKQILDSIINEFNFVRDIDILYTCDKIKDFNKNLKSDTGFILALLSIPFFELNKVSKEEKKILLKNIAQLTEDLSKTTLDDNEQDKNSNPLVNKIN